MTRPVDPAGSIRGAPAAGDGAAERRRDQRRRQDRREAETSGTALVPVGPVETHAHTPKTVETAAFAAQVLGQTGQKRGLKGGPPVLGAARGAYLGAQYAGPGDRRPPPGKGKKTEV